ncbi:MAG: DUF2786 domain-containing protein [Actinobacteria bacterium]|nr:DUF2786 domain-containing protein [Actinomycetota bacterium]
MIEKVRAILERANHPNTPQAEAETALALAYRLMQKHGLEESDVARTSNKRSPDARIITKTVTITGPYRVRRGTLFHILATSLSCADYRDMETESRDAVTMVAFGAPDDLFALETLFTAADLLALRSMPKGDRRWRTSWWHGFCAGVEEKLRAEHRGIVRDSPGAGLVLVERTERAQRIMRDSTPHLHSSRGSFVSDRDAYGVGRSAGSTFSASRRSVPGARRELGRG